MPEPIRIRGAPLKRRQSDRATRGRITSGGACDDVQSPHFHPCRRRGAGRRAGARRRRRDRRPDLADDRPAGDHRQAGAGGRQSLHPAPWRHGRRQEDRPRGQGRHRRARRDQAPRPGSHRQRQRQGADGLRPHPAGARRRAGRDRSESAGDRHRRGDGDDHREVALHRAHLLHAAAGGGADGAMVPEERHPQGRDAGRRLRPRQRRREMVRRRVREGRRPDRRKDPHAAQGPRLRAVPAAGEGRRARSPVRLPALRPGRGVHEGIRRARPRQVGHPPDRHRRRHRRRPARRHGRCGARRGDHPSLFRRPRFAGEQGVRRRLREGQQRHAAELHGGRRLRRHGAALSGAGQDQGRDRRRRADRGDEGHELDEPARARSRSTPTRATSSRTSTCARSRRSTGRSTTSSSRPIPAVKDPYKAAKQ